MTDPVVISSVEAPLITHGVLAIFGALVHASKAYRAGETKSPVDFIALAFVSSFSGVMFALIGLYLFGEASYITAAMAGTGGFVGVEGMTWVVEFVRTRIFQNK